MTTAARTIALLNPLRLGDGRGPKGWRTRMCSAKARTTIAQSDEPLAADYNGCLAIAKYVTEEKATAFEARDRIEARGTQIVTSSSVLVALVVGLSAVALGQGATITNRFAGATLALSLIAFASSAILGVVVQNSARSRKAASIKTLRDFVAENSYWNGEERDFLRIQTDLDVDAIDSLRTATKSKACQCNWALGCQVGAAVLLSGALCIEVVARLLA
ncbi:hypothetical protein M3B38_04890 [Dietzia cinnamea]|uniref:hypothetical protein n=1 Tax=Dietzia cinnamea TaxID=321318 RepID=UPI0021A8559E|nr:hypothetical protein [Dietzia cinnamea]MCT1711317.1 hypothetical protein [Dietzia cinnamea]